MKQMKAKDERILLMNEVLQGMKVLKLYAWEKPFMAKIAECRDREIESIKQNAVLSAMLWITYTGAPLVVTLVTFTIYILVDENNVLTAEKVGMVWLLLLHNIFCVTGFRDRCSFQCCSHSHESISTISYGGCQALGLLQKNR